MKNIWLKDETEKLLDKARLIWITEKKDSNVTNDLAIRQALEEYVNARHK